MINNIDNFKDKLIQAILKSDSIHYLLVDKFGNYGIIYIFKIYDIFFFRSYLKMLKFF